jgi:sugar phosphate isomerase/epimerase
MQTIDRRVFLGVLGASCLAAARTEAEKVQRVGVQLYTVRTELEKDFDGGIARVAAIGYKEVEFAGYYKRSPQQIRDMLAKNGLTAPSAHVDYPSLGEKFPAVLEAATIIGHRYLVNPWIDESIRKEPDSWKRIAGTLNRAGEQSRKAGIQFAYHNHHFEFAPSAGKLPFDVLLEECDPSLVKIELDLCWIAVAGRDPLEYFKRYPGRFPLVHVKDLVKKPEDGPNAAFDKVFPDLADVGKGGAIDWKRIFAHSKEAGIQHYFVEHDTPKAPFDSLENSYRYLSRLEF